MFIDIECVTRKDKEMSFKAVREKHKVPQAVVARVLGVARSTVSRWDKGLMTPRIKYLKALSKLWHCTINELIS